MEHHINEGESRDGLGVSGAEPPAALSAVSLAALGDAAAIADAKRDARLRKRGYCYVKASDLRWGEWVHLMYFHLQVQSLERRGDTIYVKFFSDDLPVRWWPHNYRLRVNYPRADFQPFQPVISDPSR